MHICGIFSLETTIHPLRDVVYLGREPSLEGETMLRCCATLAMIVVGICSDATYAEEIRYQTRYLAGDEAIDFVITGETSRRTHRIAIEGELGGKARLHLDGNICAGANAFGDVEVCTEVFYPPLEVALHRLRVEDPTGLGRALYAVEAENPTIRNFTLRLVVPAKGKDAARLLLNSHVAPDVILRTLTLEPLTTPAVLADAAREAPAHRTETVRIRGFEYVPRIVTIRVGDSVKWINEDAVVHTATRIDDPAFDTDDLEKGESNVVKFTKTSGQEGFEYFCKPHPFMKGRVVVVP
jgi:plastocyanin